MDQLLTIKSNIPARAISLTEPAIAKIKDLVETEGDPSLALRVAVRAGGCSGFSYEMYFDNATEDGDIVEEFDGEVKVFIDRQSLEHVKGSTLDYKDGLMDAGFSIENPNVTKSCGCGSSFS
jgi:iron-sulfur cluster assembly accessory protein